MDLGGGRPLQYLYNPGTSWVPSLFHANFNQTPISLALKMLGACFGKGSQLQEADSSLLTLITAVKY
jgi:hypothetical protein